MKNKCDCRLQISDYGYYVCKLSANHKGDHRFDVKKKSSWVKADYTITWKRNKYNDTNINLQWIKDNTNFFKILDKEILNFKDYFSSYSIDEESFNEAIYGDSFDLNIYLNPIGELKEVLKNFEAKKYSEFMKKYFMNKYNKFEEYDDIETDFQNIVDKQIKPKLNKYKVNIRISITY